MEGVGNEKGTATPQRAGASHQEGSGPDGGADNHARMLQVVESALLAARAVFTEHLNSIRANDSHFLVFTVFVVAK